MVIYYHVGYPLVLVQLHPHIHIQLLDCKMHGSSWIWPIHHPRKYEVVCPSPITTANTEPWWLSWLVNQSNANLILKVEGSNPVCLILNIVWDHCAKLIPRNEHMVMNKTEKSFYTATHVVIHVIGIRHRSEAWVWTGHPSYKYYPHPKLMKPAPFGGAKRQV